MSNLRKKHVNVSLLNYERPVDDQEHRQRLHAAIRHRHRQLPAGIRGAMVEHAVAKG